MFLGFRFLHCCCLLWVVCCLLFHRLFHVCVYGVQKCHTEQFIAKCPSCSQPLKGDMIEYEEQKFHRDCTHGVFVRSFCCVLLLCFVVHFVLFVCLLLSVLSVFHCFCLSTPSVCLFVCVRVFV